MTGLAIGRDAITLSPDWPLAFDREADAQAVARMFETGELGAGASPVPWRTGSKVPTSLYDATGQPVGRAASAQLAMAIVRVANRDVCKRCRLKELRALREGLAA